MKICKNCNAEFIPKHETRGHEQIYCSIKCRTQSYRKRVKENDDKIRKAQKLKIEKLEKKLTDLHIELNNLKTKNNEPKI